MTKYTNFYVQAVVLSTNTNFTRGNKFFELTNHLGNVLVTISDKKIQVSSNNISIDYYTADVVTANDYYPFGMQMPGRTFAQTNSAYRYGFNGKENDNEQDYGMRIYDTRIGRFFSVDPLTKAMPNQSPYNFAANSPVTFIDNQGAGPELPPISVTKALLKNNKIFSYALLMSVNASPNELYKWVNKTSTDPTAYYKLKGSAGEGVVFKRLLSDFSISWYGLLIPAPNTKIGGYNNGVQIDIQSKERSGALKTPIGNFNYSVGIRNNSFDGEQRSWAMYGMKEKAEYTINYEVKTLSPNNSTGYNFEILADGLDKATRGGKGKNTIGVLVTDKEAWLNVAHDQVYGPQLKRLYDNLPAGIYLRLEENLSRDAHKEVMSAYDTIKRSISETGKKSSN